MSVSSPRPAQPWRRSPPLWRALAGLGAVLAAIMTLASTLSPNVPWRTQVLEAFEPDTAQSVAHVAAAIGAIVLLVLSWGVWRGRRRASQAAIVVLGVLVAVNAAKGLDYEEAGIALALAVVLRAGLRASDRDRAPRGALLAALAAVAALAGAYATTVTALMLDGHPPGVGAALARGARMVASGAAPGSLHEPGRVVLHVVVGLGLIAGVLWVRALLAPARAEDGHGPDAHARAAAIVAAHGHDPLAPFVLRADKAFFFAHGAVLAYRTLRDTAVVSGDPVGPPGSARPVLADFLAHAHARGWDVVMTAAGPERLEDYASLGLRSMQVGSEAVVDPQGFSLEGRAIRKVRQSVHRVTRRGWTIDVVEAGRLTPELVGELEEAEQAWRRAAPRRMGFAMNMDRLWGAPEDARDVYVLGRAPDGELRAFLRLVGYRDGLSLDAMRRLGGEPNGLNEALVVAALEHARAAGLRQVSLNFAGFAHVMTAEAVANRDHRLMRALLRLVHGRFQLERLVQFNDKFEPAWRPRFLVYTHGTRLPLAALRVLQAESYVRGPRGYEARAAWRPASRPVDQRVAATG